MDELKAEKYLEQIETLDVRIENKRVELYQLDCLVKSITAQMGSEVVQTSGVNDKVGNIVAKIVDLKKEILRMIDEFLDEKQERIAVIEQVDDALLCKILHKHYVQYKKFKTIAKEVHYSEVSVSNKHQEALEKVQEILDREKGQGN